MTANAKCHELEARIIKLEQEKEKLECAREATAAAAPSKRKRGTEKHQSGGRPSKLNKTSAAQDKVSSLSTIGSVDVLCEDSDVFSVLGEGKKNFQLG